MWDPGEYREGKIQVSTGKGRIRVSTGNGGIRVSTRNGGIWVSTENGGIRVSTGKVGSGRVSERWDLGKCHKSRNPSEYRKWGTRRVPKMWDPG